ncbi:hypothetical protein AMAG_05845 [Allomyces macrogynus ATCC 38327]|uniref:Peroxiredoxin-like 2A n=1 Tax=Allomyces macrogynus (strain ATCC 38327) TaxID=578462 RepID=A0A0L0SD68_ALLM3|nr:hypothetical protein AMAG_05845 [Allomyces macrogynus ATCC 38327]|eukprot:KNE60458.1 hypothetical protein AMAG_05845 [Allomyces macrogynus ATCC 38327]
MQSAVMRPFARLAAPRSRSLTSSARLLTAPSATLAAHVSRPILQEPALPVVGTHRPAARSFLPPAALIQTPIARRHFSATTAATMGIFTRSVPATKTSWPLMQNVALVPIRGEEGDTSPVDPDKTVLSQTLWQDRPTMIVLIRRPGCLLCREEAFNLANQRDHLQKELGIRMVAVVNQSFGAQDFADNYWKGTCFFDKELGFFKAMGDGQIRKGSLLQLMKPSVLANMARARKTKLDSNLDGDGTILGGLLIVGPGDKGIVYEYPETEFGDHAPMETVLETCKSLAQQYPPLPPVQV